MPETKAATPVRHFAINAERMLGFECSISVPDARAAERAVVENGGTILMPRTTIPTVGHLFWFRDTEGNVAGAMQYDSKASVED